MSHVIGEVTKEMQKIRTSMEKFKKVEILESCMKALKQGLLDAHMLFNEEQAKVTRQQNVKNPQTQNPRVRRPQSPLSPMVNPSVYAPLSQTSQKDHGRNSSKTFNLEEKFENLDVLEQNDFSTQVQ